ncbi:GNAT family N-acetyltransferase [Persicirhabdus sediminis]|uniref:GNAT family N-acetyltransferase n=1 Tax=Persicirhabdus sediminis TaxID=454144 RepID=A0A8J7MBN0_9BACT|nr:GNAT family N-acetyltransferase [Persicirhabdus sediminis]MBK1790137.1 GNAT family N-acetyltransferase [Persicirhabdus sediminis]
MQCRPINDNDASSIERIQRLCFKDVGAEEIDVLAHKWHENPDACCVCTDDLGRVLGYVLAHPWEQGSAPKMHEFTDFPGDGDTFYIHDMAVCPKARNMGVAQHLLDYCNNYAASHSYKRISLVAVQDAPDYWSKKGFTPAQCNADLSGYGSRPCYMEKAIA